jgi:hypothetical protein
LIKGLIGAVSDFLFEAVSCFQNRTPEGYAKALSLVHGEVIAPSLQGKSKSSSERNGAVSSESTSGAYQRESQVMETPRDLADEFRDYLKEVNHERNTN